MTSQINTSFSLLGWLQVTFIAELLHRPVYLIKWQIFTISADSSNLLPASTDPQTQSLNRVCLIYHIHSGSITGVISYKKIFYILRRFFRWTRLSRRVWVFVVLQQETNTHPELQCDEVLMMLLRAVSLIIDNKLLVASTDHWTVIAILSPSLK